MVVVDILSASFSRISYYGGPANEDSGGAMRLEDTDGSLRVSADHLFALVEQVSGSKPEPLKGYYKAHVNGTGFVYLRLIGDGARKYPPNSIHLHTGWHDQLAGDLVTKENNWHGAPSADLTARADQPGELALAAEFIRNSLLVHGTRWKPFVSTALTPVTNASAIYAADLDDPPRRIETMTTRIVRDTQLAIWVKQQHNNRCQLCGETIRLADGSGYAEGHHLRPLGKPHNGPDVAENIVCLCPNHHAVCDLGAIYLKLNALRLAPLHRVDERFVAYHNQVVFRG